MDRSALLPSAACGLLGADLSDIAVARRPAQCRAWLHALLVEREERLGARICGVVKPAELRKQLDDLQEGRAAALTMSETGLHGPTREVGSGKRSSVAAAQVGPGLGRAPGAAHDSFDRGR